MQRRDFVRSSLFGAGAACTLTLPTAYAALNAKNGHPLRTALARLDSQGTTPSWRPIEHCSSGLCDEGRTVRVQITALGFPKHMQALSIDAMFATNDGLRPFRIAHYQPRAVSPTSKPFSFEAGSATLAGFRVEHAKPESGGVEVAGSALLGAGRVALAAGHYLLVANTETRTIDFGMLEVPTEPAQPLLGTNGRDAPFAWLRFSVHAHAA